MESMLSNFTQSISSNIYFAVFLALAAGIISSFSPCVLSSLPLIIGYNSKIEDYNNNKSFIYSLIFCIGIIITLTSLGILSSLLGKLLTGTGSWWYIFLSVLMFIIGLELLDIVNIMPNYCKVPSTSKGLIGAFSLGILGGIFSSPCSTPILAAILTFAASRGNILTGTLLLFAYSLGHCTLIMIAGTSVGIIQSLSTSNKFKRIGDTLRILLGIMVILIGFYLFYIGI